MSDTTQKAAAELPHTESPVETDFLLAFFKDLECNLLASQRALVCGDLNRLEELTAVLDLFGRKLAKLLAPASGASRVCASSRQAASSAAQREVRAAQLRILHLGRVHVALLARREQGLRTLRHWMAGPQSLYGPSGNPDFQVELQRTRVREG